MHVQRAGLAPEDPGEFDSLNYASAFAAVFPGEFLASKAHKLLLSIRL